MNFLAHLHLASLVNSSLLGNMMADFVRGDPHNHYSLAIADGIMLHRKIDRLSDTLEPIAQARRLFSAHHYRVAPIALDMVWDHFLARHWDRMEQQMSLHDFIAHAERNVVPHLTHTPPGFQYLNQFVWQERWLERYAELPFIARALNGMAHQRPKLSALASCIDDIERHYAQLDAIFRQFYPAMMAHVYRLR